MTSHKHRAPFARRRRSALPALAAVIVTFTMPSCGETNTRPVDAVGRTSHPAFEVPASASIARERTSFYSRATSMLAGAISLIAAHRPGKPSYFANGTWLGMTVCWPCDSSELAEIAAIVAQSRPTKPRYRSWAIRTVDHVIAAHQHSNGGLWEHQDGAEIETIWTVNAIGAAMLALPGRLSATTRARWTNALHRAGQYLLGDLDFYVNGNIELSFVLAMALEARITGDPVFRSAYGRALSFALRPTGARWAGFGLVVTRRPQRRDGSDGAGYLAEKGPTGPPGFDPHYTGVQAAEAAKLFAVVPSPATQRLLNLLVNQEMKAVNRRTLVITNGRGTRRPFPEGTGPFESPCIPVAALLAGRSDLAPLVLHQVSLATVDFHNYAAYALDQNSVVADYAWAVLAMRLHDS
jgi:hypothetical protein